ncbi:hypothetical protein NFHSH190041_00340 [Shewanella sp. NFH-SH190041]|uniref:NRDE family protein n=1 Tax=Shewanella sp. NFH-SH190041 TaxID=2950245 RepID=UPI0021C435F6|nr:NRDE family protein [Shewanella sp. NFH-SH190041]BDM62582.1 hypothetical protein NFHSH190041_00340 [Shewanella sp. NFH-SH190041]
MCILFIAYQYHPDYPIILCANRDEFHHRATAPAHLWPEGIVAGKDLQAGGTWLGCKINGAIAAVTNIRTNTPNDPTKLSRGELVTQALQELITPAWLMQHSQDYNPFNLVFEYQQQLYCFHSPQQQLIPISSGVHAICNGALTDIWPKMALGKQKLTQILESYRQPDLEQLILMMQDETRPADHLLPQTGLPLAWEQQFSAIFIRHPDYGTRSTSIMLYHHSGKLQFLERRYNATGEQLGEFHISLMSGHG